jgi:hypothetical protein
MEPTNDPPKPAMVLGGLTPLRLDEFYWVFPNPRLKYSFFTISRVCQVAE